ncbi:MAG: Ribosome small subunit biogenesis RbfA-release protein RsgA [uncultured Chloroflexia bacterium]|uniref:Small ribosomal subunit biogenesis GTPase RsgA n=1 Tax=uncultured Chloroflexia bacterium TaxID=1672391 RepID=A0A6J4J5J4_9CHLR|nr:MAG: Ribosome small subunit biogenesis RbfA-release protein RsgA [uncultured Chloroflexia bacterium]
MARQTGTVIKSQSGFFWVRTEAGVLRCTLRGRLKKSRVASDIATLGDQVVITPTSNGEGAVEEVLPRRSKLARRAAGSKGVWKEDVLVANLDQIVAVFAVARPEPHLRMLDRYLINAELNGVEALIVANKCDLRPREEIDALFDPYKAIGYPVLYTSAAQNAGVEELRTRLANRISGLSGPSGVGKSSLLNRVQPGLQLRTSAVSDFLNKGRHTTVVAELHPLDDGGYVADTPGIREMGLWQVPPEELAWSYREFRPWVDQCFFQPCSHLHEPNCAVRAAVDRGEIAAERYDSYTRLHEELSAEVAY